MFSRVRGDTTPGHRYLQKRIVIAAIQAPARHDTAFGHRLLPAWYVLVCSSQISSRLYKQREQANLSASQQASANILDTSVGKAWEQKHRQGLNESSKFACLNQLVGGKQQV